MASFKLTDPNGTAYDLSTQGDVSTNGASVGSWSTDQNNQIVVALGAGGSTTIPVGWAFDANNQLILSDNSGTVFNFGADGPGYDLQDNSLEVQPGDSVSFRFSLNPQWSLDASNNLVLNLAGAASTITGYVDDSSSRFIFWFEDQTQDLPEYMLVFSGAWERASVDTQVQLVFKGKVKDTGATFAFTLSQSVTYVDPAHNHLVVEYQSSQGLQRIELRGSLSILEQPGKNLGLSFSIAQQTGLQGGVATQASEIKVGATFEFSKLTGQMQIYVGQVKTQNSQKLTIGGSFQARLGSTGLEISFLYQREALTGHPPITNTVSLAINCAFTFSNGQITFSYTRSGRTESFVVQGQLMFGKVNVDFGVAISGDPQNRVVKGFLGISW